jgi:hypothetical protein
VDAAKDGLEYYYTEILTDEMGLQDKPVWITEIGAAYVCDDLESSHGLWSVQAYSDVATYMANPLISWMTGTSNPGYDKLFWYTSWTDHELSDHSADDSWCTHLYTNTIWTTQTHEVSSTLNPLGEAWAAGDW